MTQLPADGPTSIASRRSGGPVMPPEISPMLATEAPEPFDSKDHIFELMWSGLRAIAYVRDGHVRLIGRNGRDLGPWFPELSHIPGLLDANDAILDGEIVVVDAQGQPAFDALRPRLHAMTEQLRATDGAIPVEFSQPKKIAGQLCFQAADLLWLDGASLIDKPLWQRKNRLHHVLRASAEFAAVDFVDDEGIAFFEAVVQRKLEGIVAKRKASEYTPGVRAEAWQQIRALQSGDFVVGGYTFGGARRKGEPFSQLLLGGYSEGRFEYIGAVSGGVSDVEARQLVTMLEPIVVDDPAYDDPPTIARLIYWTEPELVCRVRFSEWSPDGHLRFPIFSALRPDLRPEDCLLDN